MTLFLDNNLSFLDAETIYQKEYFRRKNLRLYQGDSTLEQLFDREFIDLIVTSPPYNVGIEYNSNTVAGMEKLFEGRRSLVGMSRRLSFFPLLPSPGSRTTSS